MGAVMVGARAKAGACVLVDADRDRPDTDLMAGVDRDVLMDGVLVSSLPFPMTAVWWSGP
jgi:hypothetical protein